MARACLGVLVAALLATGCSSTADLDTQTVDSACRSAASALEAVVQAASRLRFDDEATTALDSIAADIDGTDLAALIESTSSALVDLYTPPLEDDRLKQLEHALEVRQTTSELGLWCTRNTSPSTAEELAPVFFSSS